MDSEYQKIRPIIDAFDKMREILRNEEIDLPKIVVVGDQSSGKSSVLESITGLNLPRGQNTVTRCPIVIQLKRVSKKTEENATLWIEGEDENNFINISNLSQLSEAISSKQKILIEKDKQEISKTAINVKVYKENAPDLTLYDLPGITYKNEKIIEMIRDIINKYTLGISTIILLVLPANCDLTTSEALSIIKKQPNFRTRTLAVITKIDLGEKGIGRKVADNELDLKYDPIIVRNRTQEEIEKNEDWDTIRKKEKEFINFHDELKLLNNDSKGTFNLINKLVSLQREILINASYTIKEELNKRLNLHEEELKKLPLPVNTLSEKLDRFKSCLRDFIKMLKNSMDNNISLEKDKKYNIPARIREIFDEFNAEFSTLIHGILSKEFCENIKFMVKESRGLLLQNFLNPKVFEKLVVSEIKKAIDKQGKLITNVQKYISDILQEYCKKNFAYYPNLMKNISVELNRQMSIKKQEVENLIMEIKECESNTFSVSKSYSEMYNSLIKEVVRFREIFLDYKVVYQEFAHFLDSPLLTKNKGNDFEETCLNLQMACYSYWKVFECRFLDYLEMIVLKKMVYFFQDNLEDILDMLFSPSSNKISQQIITEDASITSRRRTLVRSIHAFREAMDEFENLEKFS